VVLLDVDQEKSLLPPGAVERLVPVMLPVNPALA
jgi:hypothetical protein